MLKQARAGQLDEPDGRTCLRIDRHGLVGMDQQELCLPGHLQLRDGKSRLQLQHSQRFLDTDLGHGGKCGILY
jgi:hypothetical protein